MFDKVLNVIEDEGDESVVSKFVVVGFMMNGLMGGIGNGCMEV